MNPLMFADWRSMATTFTVICWLAVLVLAAGIVSSVPSHVRVPAHRAVMLAR
jgi:hypothetical protein